MADQRIALVTGGNRGIGFEVCRQLAEQGMKVILSGRSLAKVNEAAKQLRAEGLDVVAYELDVTDAHNIMRLEVLVRRNWGRLDVLVNNAALYFDSSSRNEVCTVDLETVQSTMDTNLYGPLRLCQTFVPLMKEQNYGRIVNVSTGMAQLKTIGRGWPAYRFSKVALNALTRILADEVNSFNILVNAVSPGWVRTEMGGPQAPRSVDKGAETIVWLATLPDNGPTGGFYYDQKPMDW